VPRTCTVCSHPDREAIDRALVSRDASNRRIASQHDVTERAVRNHKANHLPATLMKAQDAQEVAEADDLLGQVRDLQARTLSILEAAEGASQHRTALSAIREARSNLELLAKLLGELDDSPTVNVLVSPQWIEIRTVLLEALTAYPEARSAVAGRLLALEAS
jgi:transposase-like protein